MSHRLRSLVLSLSLAASATVGCTLIAEVDRSKIPEGEGDGGEGNSGDGDQSQGGEAGSNGEGGAQ
ncbi:MAG TPA: hypothetical protein VN764_16960 [Polyangiaceae bacterium]|nr:hypothetical protein [Polyangiaceae bacterium]